MGKSILWLSFFVLGSVMSALFVQPFVNDAFNKCEDIIGLAIIKSLKEHPEKWTASSRDSLSLANEGGKDGHLLLWMGVSYSGSNDYKLNDIPRQCHGDIKDLSKRFLEVYANTIPVELR